MPISWLSSKGKIAAILLLAVAALAPLPVRAADDTLSPAANASYLRANAAKPGTVTRPSGLQYRILRNGTGKRPGGDDLLRISYAVHLVNGALVDSTNPALPQTISQNTIGMAGLAEALAL